MDHLDQNRDRGDHREVRVAGGGQPFVHLAVALHGFGQALAVQDQDPAHAANLFAGVDVVIAWVEVEAGELPVCAW